MEESARGCEGPHQKMGGTHIEGTSIQYNIYAKKVVKDTLLQEVNQRHNKNYSRWEEYFIKQDLTEAILVEGLTSTINEKNTQNKSLTDAVFMLVVLTTVDSESSTVYKELLGKFINDTQENCSLKSSSPFRKAFIYNSLHLKGQEIQCENEALCYFRDILKGKVQSQKNSGQVVSSDAQDKGEKAVCTSHAHFSRSEFITAAGHTDIGNDSPTNPTVECTQILTNSASEEVQTCNPEPLCSVKTSHDIEQTSRQNDVMLDSDSHKKTGAKKENIKQDTETDVRNNQRSDILNPLATNVKQPQQILEQQKPQSAWSLTLKSPDKTIVRDKCGITRKYYRDYNEQVLEKVIILIGASKTGKTMLVNLIANYFLENDSSADKLISVETVSKTSTITAYSFYSSEHNMNFTVIDTPGLNDDSGKAVQSHVQSLKTFLANTAEKKISINAIGFVAQSHMARLTSPNRLVLNYVSSLFGQNVAEHLLVLVTFADFLSNPQVLKAMNNYEVKFRDSFLFHNSILHKSPEKVKGIDKEYYKVSKENWKKCLGMLKDMPPLSINTVQAIQSEIFATTVIESAEKDLIKKLTLFKDQQKEECRMQTNIRLCERIWELASFVRMLRDLQQSTASNEVAILKEFVDKIYPGNPKGSEMCLKAISLAPSNRLVISAIVVIKTIASQFIKYPRCTNIRAFEMTLTDQKCLFCHGCKNVPAKFRVTRISTENMNPINCTKCKNLVGYVEFENCDEATDQRCEIISYTNECLDKILKENSETGYPVQKRYLLEFLKHFIGQETEGSKAQIELIVACINSISSQKSKGKETTV